MIIEWNIKKKTLAEASLEMGQEVEGEAGMETGMELK